MALSQKAIEVIQSATALRPVPAAELIAAINAVGTTGTSLSPAARDGLRYALGDRRKADEVISVIAVTAGSTLTDRTRRALRDGLAHRRTADELATRLNNDVAY